MSEISKKSRARALRTALAAGVAVGGVLAVAPAGASTSSSAVTPFLARYFAAQDAALMPTNSNVSGTLSSLYGEGSAAAALRNYQMRTATGFHNWVAMHGDRYRSIHSSFAVRSLHQQASTATAMVDTETTMLWSPGVSSSHVAFTKEKAAEMADLKREGKLYGPKDVITSRVATTHVMTFVRSGSSWRVTRDDYSDPLSMSLAADHVSPAR